MPLPIDPMEAIKKERITLTLDGIETMALITVISTILEFDIPEGAKEALRSLYRKLGSAIDPSVSPESQKIRRMFDDEHTK